MPTKKMSSVETPPLFAAFDTIRIINLKHRADRRAEMSQQLANVGMLASDKLDFFPAVACTEPGMFMSRGAHGCFLSHIRILAEAAANNHSVLILEDDCDFRPEIWSFAAPSGFDIFYGGCLEGNPDDVSGGDIIGAHMMGFSAQAAKVATNYFSTYTSPDFAGDDRARSLLSYNPNIRPPIDGGYVWLRRAYPELKTVFAMLSDQRRSRSDITPTRLADRVPLVRDAIEFLRRWQRRTSS